MAVNECEPEKRGAGMNITGRPPYQKGQPKEVRPEKSYRSKRIKQSAEGESCLADWCGRNGSTETTVLCHIRKFGVAGMGEKPPDFLGFYGCFTAHRMFDQSKDVEWSWEGVIRAMMITQIKLNQKGLLIAV